MQGELGGREDMHLGRKVFALILWYKEKVFINICPGWRFYHSRIQYGYRELAGEGRDVCIVEKNYVCWAFWNYCVLDV